MVLQRVEELWPLGFRGSGALVLNEFGEALLELLDERGMCVQDLSDALRESTWPDGPGCGPGAGLLLACMTDAGDLANHATPSFLVGVGEVLDLDTDEIEQMLWAYYKPEGRVREALKACRERLPRDHVLVEAKLTATG